MGPHFYSKISYFGRSRESVYRNGIFNFFYITFRHKSLMFCHFQLQSPWPGGGGLEDIRSAIKQLTLRSRDSSSTATSGASSAGGGSNNGVPGTLIFI